MKTPHSLEMLWWLATFIVVALVLLPIFSEFPSYPFFGINILFIIVFITLARYIFLLPHTFLAKRFWLKISLIFIGIPFTFMLFNKLNDFHSYLDNGEMLPLLDAMHDTQQAQLLSFLYKEMTFFGAAAIISSILFILRMVVSIWRVRNNLSA